MAMSLNGYIARENGSEDFLSHENWEKFCSFAKEYGNFIVGRKAYEAVKSWGEGYGFDDLKGITKIIISQNQNYKLDIGYILASSPEDALLKLKDFDTVLITGGSTINSAFAKLNLLDKVILNVEPIIIGKGIPLFALDNFDLNLELTSSEKSASGILTLTYKVRK